MGNDLSIASKCSFHWSEYTISLKSIVNACKENQSSLTFPNYYFYNFHELYFTLYNCLTLSNLTDIFLLVHTLKYSGPVNEPKQGQLDLGGLNCGLTICNEFNISIEHCCTLLHIIHKFAPLTFKFFFWFLSSIRYRAEKRVLMGAHYTLTI